MPCFQSSVDGIMSTDMKSLGWAKLLRRNLSGSRASSISLRSSKILSLHSKLFESSVRFKSWVSMNISPQLRNSDVFCYIVAYVELDTPWFQNYVNRKYVHWYGGIWAGPNSNSVETNRQEAVLDRSPQTCPFTEHLLESSERFKTWMTKMSPQFCVSFKL